MKELRLPIRRKDSPVGEGITLYTGRETPGVLKTETYLFNTAKLACENLAGAVGIVDLVPNNIVTVTLCFYITPYLKGQNRGVGCSCGRGTGNGWGRRQRSIVRFIE